MQVRQIAGMRGLVANPRGDMIPRPIKSNFREGLEMLEYFIATPGARKGLVDTALRTADSGYLTRRLVDVAQELIINDEDPFERPAPSWHLDRRRHARHARQADLPRDAPLRPRARRRRQARRMARSSSRAPMVGDDDWRAMRDDETVTACGSSRRSPTTPTSASRAKATACRWPPASTIELGEAVGVIAAQSIGEPGTQLTMRTFHTGGVAVVATSLAVCLEWSSSSRLVRPRARPRWLARRCRARR